MINYLCMSIPGSGHNQDSFYCDGITVPIHDKDNLMIFRGSVDSSLESRCFAVFDGVGGGSYGEIASFVCSEYLKDYIQEKNFLEYIKRVADRLNTFSSDNVNDFVGSTAAIVNIYDQHLQCINVGDSNVIVIRNKEIFKLTIDDLFIDEHGTKYLFQAISNRSIPNYHENHFDLIRGDIVLIYTDGVESNIYRIIENLINNSSKIDQFIISMLNGKDRDDATIVILEIA